MDRKPFLCSLVLSDVSYFDRRHCHRHRAIVRRNRQSSDIVDRSDLDRRGVESVAEGLREVPGLRVTQRGGPGSYTTIQTRGLRVFDTAVLVDGMRFRDVAATQGDAGSFIADLMLVDTGRIEVLRGAGSSLYGTNAMGGVVNIVTDSGSGRFHGGITADGGGLGEFRGLARVGRRRFREPVALLGGSGPSGCDGRRWRRRPIPQHHRERLARLLVPAWSGPQCACSGDRCLRAAF